MAGDSKPGSTLFTQQELERAPVFKNRLVLRKMGSIFFIHTTGTALGVSVVFTLLALFFFGYVKGRFRPFRSAIQTALIGGLAAAVAFGLAKLISR